MTVVKLDSKVTKAVATSLHPHAERLYRDQGCHVIAVVELHAVERVEPADEEEKPRSVKLRVTDLRIATGEDEHLLRELASRLTSDGQLRLGDGSGL